MRLSTIFWSLTLEEKANLVKRFLLLSFILTRFSNEIEGLSSSSSVSFGDRGDSPFDQSTPNQLLPFHNHHHHRNNHHHNHHHRHRHHHGSKSTSSHQHNQPPPLTNQLIDQQLTNHELDSLLSSRPSSDGTNKSIKSDGDKPCASCASLDEKLFVKLKLEAIKNQILSKLHLDTQPNVTSELSDSMAIDALLESKSIQLKRGDVSSPRISSTPHQSSILSSLSASPFTASSTVSKSHRGLHQPQPSQSNLGKTQSNTNSNPHSDKVSELSESEDDYYGTTSEIISFPEPGILINGHTLLEFTLPSTNIDLLDVVSAKLWVKVEPWGSKVFRKLPESQKINLFIFAARNISTNKQEIESMNGTLSSIPGVYFDQILMKKIPASTGWKQLDLTNEVQRWFASRTKLSLMIDCSGCEGKVKFLLFDPNELKLHKPKANSASPPQSSNSIESSGKERKDRPTTPKQSYSSPSSLPGSQYRPYLIINTRPKNLKRMKRDFPSTCDPNFRHCCVQQLFVNFTHLGWDSWIISPSGYYAGYCAGNCLKPIKTPEIYAWYHSYVMDHYREANPYASISPCCTPTRLEPLQIMHWVGNSAIISNLPNMIVKECGCS